MSTEAAHAIHQAITSKDNNGLISAIARFDNEELQTISAEYAKHYGKALPEAIKDDASGDYAALLIDLIIPRASFAARVIHNAITGAGTDENALTDALVHNTKQQITDIKTAYSNIFSRDLTTAISSDVSFHFKKVLLSILEAQSHGLTANPEVEAEAIYKKGEGKWGTDDDFFVEFFSKHNHESLAAIDHAYNAKYGHPLETAIKKETSGAFQNILVALAAPREVFWARRIRSAIAGLGTNDELLRRAFSLNSKDQLRRIDAVYGSVNHGKTLRSDVADDTSGHYKVTFLAILESL